MKKMSRVILCTFAVACLVMGGLGVGTAAAASPLATAADSKANESNNQGIEAYKGEDLEKAHGSFAQAVEADPESAEAHYNLALVMDKMGEHRAAAKEFKKAQDLGKDNPDIQNSKILKDHVGMLE